MKWPTFKRKKASPDTGATNTGAQEGERFPEVPAKVFSAKSSTGSQESLSTTSGSTVSNCSSYLPKATSGYAVDPRERPSVQRYLQERLEKSENSFGGTPEMISDSNVPPIMPTVVEDDVYGVVDDSVCWDPNDDSACRSACQSFVLDDGACWAPNGGCTKAHWWTGKFFACSMIQVS